MATSFSDRRLSKKRVYLMAGLAIGLLGGCSGQRYNYTFNDNVVFGPGASAGAPRAVLRDAALQACLNQVMEAAQLSDPATVKLLACPGSGVETLAGIDSLQQLENLELSDNRIDDLGPLSRVRNLRVLSVRNNRITNIGALKELALLRFVSLQDNNQIPCVQIEELKSRLGNTFNAPAQCVE